MKQSCKKRSKHNKQERYRQIHWVLIYQTVTLLQGFQDNGQVYTLRAHQPSIYSRSRSISSRDEAAPPEKNGASLQSPGKDTGHSLPFHRPGCSMLYFPHIYVLFKKKQSNPQVPLHALIHKEAGGSHGHNLEISNSQANPETTESPF